MEIHVRYDILIFHFVKKGNLKVGSYFYTTFVV